MKPIKHIWFDLDGTLTQNSPEREKAHDKLRYDAYAEVTGKPLSVELFDEFERLYKKEGSNSAVFRSLGLPSDYWMTHYAKLDPSEYHKPNRKVNSALKSLKEIVPISIFTNTKPAIAQRTLESVGIKKEWFTHILTGDDIPERKPALDGFHAIVETSQLPADEILYVGDRIRADIEPAKKVGIQTCLVWSESKEADYSFKKFEDLLTLF